MHVEARLRAFSAVVRKGSFSRAAEELFVSQPAISKHVAALETELGVILVQRSRTGAVLTEQGERLADYVLRAEALLANARRAVNDPSMGTLSVAASGIPGTYLLPPILAQFTIEHPGVELDLRLSTSGGALELVRAHTSEIGVVGGLQAPPELVSESLTEDEVLLVGPPHLAGRRLRATELGELTWISREEGSATRASLEAALWQIGVTPRRRLELDSWEAVKLAVASGLGVGAVSHFALKQELAAGALTILDVPRWRVRRTIAAVYARDVPLTRPSEHFLATLRAAFMPVGQRSLAR